MNVLIVSMILFSAGLYGVLTRRDLVAVLAAIEVMLGSATLLLVGMAASGVASDGAGLAGGTVEVTGVMIIVLAAAEAAIGLALVVAVSRRFRTTRIDELTRTRG